MDNVIERQCFQFSLSLILDAIQLTYSGNTQDVLLSRKNSLYILNTLCFPKKIHAFI